MRAIGLLVLACTLGVGVVGCTRPTEVARCTAATDCPAGRTCVDGVCFLRPDASAPRDAAGRCSSDADCTAIASCAAHCDEGACIAVPDDTRCAGAERCDATLGCVPRIDGGSMMDAPTFDANDAFALPDARDAPLDVPPDAPPGEVGAPCTAASGCVSPVSGRMAVCLTAFGGETFAGGYCSTTCSISSTNCGPDAACVLVSGGSGTCLRRCGSDSECRPAPDYECARAGLIGSVDVCTPPGL